MKLTEMQEIVLICINEFINENEKTPSIRDIACDLDRSVATIYHHLKKLKQAGLVNFDECGKILGVCQK